ncbi:MAG: zinc-binding dehydrogenase, partial [Labilithrix sp.]|nr:zinc-binding dehydrogenase [Labilithrix sp.]
GGLGHYAVQIASTFGYEVIGVDVGADRLDFVKSLGAAAALDDAPAAFTPCGGVCGVKGFGAASRGSSAPQPRQNL